MSSKSLSSPMDVHPPKRTRFSSPDKNSSPLVKPSPTADEYPDGNGGFNSHNRQTSKVGQSSNFRNVSACNRCRSRKNKCDQKLPSCASCEKVGVPCIGYDPISKREIPRSFVFYLETRVAQLESLLQSNNISFPPANDLHPCSHSGVEAFRSKSPSGSISSVVADSPDGLTPRPDQRQHGDTSSKPSVSSNPRGFSTGYRHQCPTSETHFGRLVFSAIQSSIGDLRGNSEKGSARLLDQTTAVKRGASTLGTSMRDSFFGLQSRLTIEKAEFPPENVARSLIRLYFEHANPQIPVLHRDDFMQMFKLAYSDEGQIRGPRELYMLNMVFAIGSAIIVTTSPEPTGEETINQAQPEEYHASAMPHIESCLNQCTALDRLAAILLLANFALLRPVPPGLWYIVGTAVRMAIDLGLYYEDGKDVESGLSKAEVRTTGEATHDAQFRERGRREYIRDWRRRLWWCTYAFDRLVSTCTGRPFGVSDQVITTEFPCIFDDEYITPNGITQPPAGSNSGTYKVIALHYFKLRLLQSEMVQVLQYQQAKIARSFEHNDTNRFMHTNLLSPFLQKFDSFRSWRIDIDKRLFEWKNSVPKKQSSGVLFPVEFLELNYWQAIITLYRQSLSVPAMFEGEYHTSKDISSPSIYPTEDRGDKARVYVKVAEAGQRVIRLYRQLHRINLVNYTYLATHHLFVAGISYLYAIWHSPIVRSRLTMDEVDFTILAANSVLDDLIDKCPPAELCRDALNRTAKSTIKMANSAGGFGEGARLQGDYMVPSNVTTSQHDNTRLHPSQVEPLASRPLNSSRYEMPLREPYPSTLRDFSGPHGSREPQSPKNQGRRASSGIKTETNLDSIPQGSRAGSEQYYSAGNHADPSCAPDNSAIDPSLLPSPGISQVQSSIIVNGISPGSANALVPPSPNTPSYFYNNLTSSPYTSGYHMNEPLNMNPMQDPQLGAGGGSFCHDPQMDLGLGFGWESSFHDFSEGQQLDLYGGLFFGGVGPSNGTVVFGPGSEVGTAAQDSRMEDM